MRLNRSQTAVVGLVASVAVSVAIWIYFDSLLLFLFVPFVPFLLGRDGVPGRSAPRTDQQEARPSARVCPECGFRTLESGYDYCPRDGTALER